MTDRQTDTDTVTIYNIQHISVESKVKSRYIGQTQSIPCGPMMVPAVLLLSTLVLHGAAGADVDCLSLSLLSSALLIGLLPVVLHLSGVTQSTSEETLQITTFINRK